MKIEIEDGKYTYIFHQNGRSEALRFGEPWRDLIGDKFVYCMAAEIEKLRGQRELLANEVAELKRFLDAAITDARYFENQRDELMDQLECIVDGCAIKNNDEMPMILNDARKLIKRLKV